VFSGIVEEIGKVVKKQIVPEGIRFGVSCRKILKRLKVSDSISVNGVCQTVVKKDRNGFEFESVHHTLKRTALGELEPGDEVNLEASLRVGGELGGHFVFGHIDDKGVVSSFKRISGKNYELVVKLKPKYRKYLIPAGAIAVNGVSLTVAKILERKERLEIMATIIPYTYDNTMFKSLKPGDKVNVEFDFLGKYVKGMLEGLKVRKLKG
jgi:riboflavin synthase